MLFGLLRLLDHDLFAGRRANSLPCQFLDGGYCAKSFCLLLFHPDNHRPAHAAILTDNFALRRLLHNVVDWVSSPSRRGGDYAIIAIWRRTVADCMEERDFFDEKQEKKPASLNCPHCHQSADYEVTWIVRTKKKQLAGRADERDRARFAKARSYMVRKDDMMACKNMRCRKRFDISGQSTVITE